LHSHTRGEAGFSAESEIGGGFFSAVSAATEHGEWPANVAIVVAVHAVRGCSLKSTVVRICRSTGILNCSEPWYREVRFHLPGFGLLVAGVLHGLDNYLADGWGGVALAALTVFTFVGYVRMGDRVGARLAQDGGRPSDGHRIG
jgi:hypothetical protein